MKKRLNHNIKMHYHVFSFSQKKTGKLIEWVYVESDDDDLFVSLNLLLTWYSNEYYVKYIGKFDSVTDIEEKLPDKRLLNGGFHYINYTVFKNEYKQNI
jgi:hypothetical protein